LTTDADDLMPPEKSGKKLTPVQKETLRLWVAGGAKYARHWAFEPPVDPPTPSVEPSAWPRNAIDHFVLQRLQIEGLKPAPDATPERWLRRVSLDLTGLPPTPGEIETFRQSTSHNPKAAMEAAVDRLLMSPHFGERMAIDWLDTARYADTNGYFGDKPRQAWPWRDWVIEAFNRNLPFDQFTIEQLAGDLLPHPTRDQLVATGFQRNCMANNESGIIDEEYRTEYVVDRLNTAAATWLGITVGCAQCHDHKYDPLTQKEFYQLFAFFNSTVDTGLIKKDDPPPVIEVPTVAQQAEVQRLSVATKAAEKEVEPFARALQRDIAEWEKTAVAALPELPSDAILHCDFNDSPGPAVAFGTTVQYEPGIRGSAAKFDATQHVEAPAALAWNADQPWTVAVWLKSDGVLSCVWSKIEAKGPRRGIEMIWQKGRLQVNLVHEWGVNAIEVVTRDPIKARDWHQVVLSYEGGRKAAGVQIIIDGVIATVTVNRDTLSDTIATAEPLRIGRRDAGLGFHGLLDEFRVLPRATPATEAAAWFDSERLRGILATAPGKRGSAATLLRDYYLRHHAQPQVREVYARLDRAKKDEQSQRDMIPTALVMQDLPQPRATHVLDRGQYDHPGELVQPGVPAFLPAMAAEAPRNRLGFARWLVSPDNPLAARMMVNRLWMMCFGEGLVRTPNDFGTQGEPPTHPELLDHLAVRFMQSGWDVKAMLKLMVLSRAYGQSSAATAELLQCDPENRLLARGPRFRLPAELIRDQALAVSGLLSSRVGGASARPWQPIGLWEAVSYNGEETYVPDADEGRYRRSLYTYWKRQAPPPALMSFDAPTREKCLVRRARTNTPLQALVLLNDETYAAAARALAVLTLQQPGATSDEARLRGLFQRITSRLPQQAELDLLQGLLNRQRQRFDNDPRAAKQWLDTNAA
ncbi:MAG: Planctomycete cytochrome, partial [Verrucomicrobiaceae bacterium]|nr:Planctomycete cytochrome [Verrucomicrobiaceae bacterium]